MRIENEFSVGVPIDTAWAVLTDLENVAPCLPGAVLTGRDGEDYLGKVKVKLGPVTSEFSGKAHFEELNDADHRAVIHAQGREVRGGGNAQVAIVARLSEHSGRTIVSVDADLRIAGKIAQFGSGMIQQVSTALLGEFATRLEHKLAASYAAQVIPTEEPEALNLLTYTRGAVAPRLVPLVLGVIALVAVVVITLR